MINETNVTAPVNVTGASVTNTVANHAEKPKKINGQSFKRWQQKMFFYLTTLNLARFLKETAPQVEPPKEGQPFNAQVVQAVKAWKHSDFLCHNYVLNSLLDDLYNVYCKTTTAKELWESWYSKNVITQVQDLQILIHEIHSGGMTVSETFQVAAIIEKLPPSWVDSKNYLKAKGKGKKKNDKKGKGKAEYLAPKAGIVNLRQANMVNDNMDMIVMVAVDNGKKLYMGNSATADINGEGDVILKMTFEDKINSRKKRLNIKEAKKATTEESFGPDFVSFMVENEPTSYREVITSSKGHQWKEAIKSEIDFILQNHTWELMDLPLGRKPLGYKWIFKKKIKADGTIDKYKARLVIKGFRQREEFLNRDLEEEIYMNQPEGFIAPGQEGKVCRLVKSLYGLNQAPKQWHQKFDHTMLESGFKINVCDNNDKMIKSTKDILKLKFDMKDMGLADVILGIKIIRTHNGLVLSQAYYVDKILNTHNAGDSALARSLELKLTPVCIYLKIEALSRYTSNPSDAHWKAMTMVLYYLRYSRNYRLHYDRYLAVIEGYSDANWISYINDSRSTSENMFTLGGSGISWKSLKQTVIAKSMMESEFIALDKYGEKAE
uniref:Reverse transcriptase Ty1/copia-type domain-containing protein n=1 Tax=Tanacetum cinerariifolium TaxID=118510 RepID=A0A6L2LHZ7_TANCI|nr:hypothetical protein [Tanacetum cinerariifolium]